MGSALSLHSDLRPPTCDDKPPVDTEPNESLGSTRTSSRKGMLKRRVSELLKYNSLFCKIVRARLCYYVQCASCVQSRVPSTGQSMHCQKETYHENEEIESSGNFGSADLFSLLFDRWERNFSAGPASVY